MNFDERRLKYLKEETDSKQILLELLAGIHGDGGQYTDLKGLGQSVFDAEKYINNLKNKNKQTMNTIRALRVLLNLEPNTIIDPNWWDDFMNDMTTLNALLEITGRNDYEDVLCEYEGMTVEELIESKIKTNN